MSICNLLLFFIYGASKSFLSYALAIPVEGNRNYFNILEQN